MSKSTLARPALLALILGSCVPFTAPPPAPRAESREAAAPPALAREFRAAWVATVANIDWPSSPGLTTGEQQAEMVRLLDHASALNLNAIILQVRPAGDALYPSEHEPWSEYLTGAMGRAPEPYYDPLEFAVEEAHRRGLELHVWFNPYRAGHPSMRSEVSADHLSRTRPDLVREYGRYLWMDPGEPEVREHTIRVIMDVVRRYDVDGVHFDDYFYPYAERAPDGGLLDFPDEPSWERYRSAGGDLSRDDWRRDNVDRLVRDLYREIKREKPWVRFGISPFGIWRPGHPEQIRGFDAYSGLYADARKWLVSGWVDYFTPQLYWPIAQTPQSYPVLLNWWAEQNVHRRHLWPGGIPSRVAGAGGAGWPASEIVAQINVARGHPGASGYVHFSMRSLMRDDTGLAQALVAGPYAGPALPPPAPWISTAAPGRPRITLRRDAESDGLVVALEPVGEPGPNWWVVRARYESGWTTRIVPGWRRTLVLDAGASAVAVSGVDRTGNEGPLATVRPGR